MAVAVAADSWREFAAAGESFCGRRHDFSRCMLWPGGQGCGEYEDRVHPWPDTSTPATVLASLMEEHGLKQSDLPEVGAQSVVSALLAGKRRLNLRQVKALAKRFSVPLEVLA